MDDFVVATSDGGETTLEPSVVEPSTSSVHRRVSCGGDHGSDVARSIHRGRIGRRPAMKKKYDPASSFGLNQHIESAG